MADDELLRDLGLTRRSFGRLVADRSTVDLGRTAGGDLQTVSGRANLAQAITNRLLTRRGELAALGHRDYGSRLHELTGELNNPRVRALAEIYIRRSLAEEPRIESVGDITFAPPERGRDRTLLEVTVAVTPRGADDPITLVLSLPVEG